MYIDRFISNSWFYTILVLVSVLSLHVSPFPNIGNPDQDPIMGQVWLTEDPRLSLPRLDPNPDRFWTFWTKLLDLCCETSRQILVKNFKHPDPCVHKWFGVCLFYCFPALPGCFAWWFFFFILFFSTFLTRLYHFISINLHLYMGFQRAGENWLYCFV